MHPNGPFLFSKSYWENTARQPLNWQTWLVACLYVQWNVHYVPKIFLSIELHILYNWLFFIKMWSLPFLKVINLMILAKWLPDRTTSQENYLPVTGFHLSRAIGQPLVSRPVLNKMTSHKINVEGVKYRYFSSICIQNNTC
jgi:hypothetical protein